jgi:hypothetical protein
MQSRNLRIHCRKTSIKVDFSSPPRIPSIVKRSSSGLLNTHRLSLLFTSWNISKSDEAKSGQYGGWEAFLIPFASRKSINDRVVCGRALSAWTINLRALHVPTDRDHHCWRLNHVPPTLGEFFSRREPYQLMSLAEIKL